MKRVLQKHTYSKRISLFAALTAFLCVAALPTPTHAVTANSSLLNTFTNCSTGSNTVFTGLLSVPQDNYSVYVHLQKRGQLATVQAYAQVNEPDSGCVSIGQPTVARGDGWTEVGTWYAPGTTKQTIFQISSADLGSELDANRPSVMLVSQTNPVCVPSAECLVTVNGQQGYVSPPGTLPTLDSLHVVRAIDPTKDIVKKVTYFVNDKAVYSTPRLQDFDLRYVSYSNQTLSRVIQYQSGQQVVLQALPPTSFNDSFRNFLFRVFESNPKTIPTLLWVIGLSLLGGIIMGILHAMKKHRQWEMDHGFIHSHYALITDKDRREAFLRDHITTIIGRVATGIIIFGLIIVAIIALNMYIATLFRVDGHSMESTYANGTEVFINKIPVTLAHSSGVDFTPSRGDVVILHAVYGVTDQETADSQEGYIIKRVIGLPGERVLVKNSKITIFNQAHPEGFDPDLGSKWQKTYHENDPNEDVDLTLGANELFVSGDNRPVSVDSRFNGPIKTSEVIGEAVFKVWPF